MVYANKSMLTNDMNASTIASRYPIWLAQYNSSATYTGAYSYWQYTSSGTVPGIEGRVDMNFYYSTDGSFSSKINIPVPTGETAPADAKIVYATHIQTYGWEKRKRMMVVSVVRLDRQNGLRQSRFGTIPASREALSIRYIVSHLDGWTGRWMEILQV